MDFQSLLNWAFGIATTVFGWLARELYSQVKENERELSKLKETLPKEYIMKEDFKDFRADVMDVLERIENKLDRKQDK